MILVTVTAQAWDMLVLRMQDMLLKIQQISVTLVLQILGMLKGLHITFTILFIIT
jgi:hypothetical protein